METSAWDIDVLYQISTLQEQSGIKDCAYRGKALAVTSQALTDDRRKFLLETICVIWNLQLPGLKSEEAFFILNSIML